MGKGIESKLNSATTLVSNKRARSLIFLLISFIIILAINAMLPVIEGQAHFTVGTEEHSYSEYLSMKSQSENYNLTWATEQRIKLYEYDYIKNHPELTEEEKVSIEVPGNFKVNVNTKFFYEYPFWYMSTLTSLVSAVLLFYSLFNYLLISSKDKYEKYVKLEEEISSLCDNNLDPSTFEPWMDDVFNKDRKVQQHIRNIKYYIEKLEKKTKYEHKKRFREYFKATSDEARESIFARYTYEKKVHWYSNKRVLRPGITKKERKYFDKKEQLLNMLEPSYIETYAVNGTVPYFNYIHPMFVYSGTNNIGRTVDGYSTVKSDGKQIASDAGAKVIVSLSITLVFSTLLTLTAVSSVDQDPLWMWINIIAKLAPLFMQVPMAFDYNNSFMSKQLIPNLLTRRAISLRYLADNPPKKEATKDAKAN